MKPRTKLQQQVYSLRKNLPYLNKIQEKWIYDNAHDHVGYRTKSNLSCLDCGNIWVGPQKVKACKCPECGIKLVIIDTRKKKLDQEIETVALLQVVNDFQVVRLFETYSYHKAGERPRQGIIEIVQQWFKPGGKLTIVARAVSFGKIGWHGDMEIRTNISNFWSNNKYDLYAYKFLPNSEVLPIYQRNGWTNKLESIPPYSFLKNLLVWSRMETIVKAGQLKLAAYNSEKHIWKYWTSIKICIRRKYIIKDAGLWLDYMDLLSYFSKDLLNDKFICPKNLKREHDRLVSKKNVILDRERREREIEKAKRNAEKIAAAEIAYKENKAAFIGMMFTNGKLTIKVLENISEFMAEAEAHKHCVFTNEYYAKPDSLILSARVDDKPVETVELSLSKMKVVQSRGKGNNATEYHNDIIALVTKNIPLIRKKLKRSKTAAA